MTKGTAALVRELERRALLLLQDKSLPNVVSLITGESVRGSWWAHPRSHEIFRRVTELGDHPDVMFCKLVAGKVTLVHRRLWPALVAVATSGEPWQTAGLPASAKSLHERVEKGEGVVASGDPVRELERRLLVVAREEHTDTGAHRTRLESWKSWAENNRIAKRVTPGEGKRQIEEAVTSLGAAQTALPWLAGLPRRRYRG